MESPHLFGLRHGIGPRTPVEERDLCNSLCSRCRSGTVMRRKGNLDVSVFCHAMHRYVPADIEECSNYIGKKELHLTEMAEIAFLIDARPDLGGYR